ncbi:MAG TPA: histidine phosphatase family protein [Solirubrobacterales bacterium]|nr:histidine phosphatase family protein [Solirubrobacterales bacterium]
MAMRALFLRHGQSAHNAHRGEEPLVEAEGDRLTELGHRQAKAAGAALRGAGVTRLLSSDMLRARETADAVGAAIGLEPQVLDYTGEVVFGESFDDAVARVRRLKEALDSGAWGERPLLVTHGIFIRFFLLDAVLGDRFSAETGEGIWRLGSLNCGLTTFSRGEARTPWGTEVPDWTLVSWMERPWDRG